MKTSAWLFLKILWILSDANRFCSQNMHAISLGFSIGLQHLNEEPIMVQHNFGKYKELLVQQDEVNRIQTCFISHVALPKSFSFPQLSFASHVHVAWLPRSSALSQPPPAEENTGDEKHWGCFYGENTCMINVLIVHLLLPGLNFGKSKNTVSLMAPEQWNNKPQV